MFSEANSDNYLFLRLRFDIIMVNSNCKTKPFQRPRNLLFLTFVIIHRRMNTDRESFHVSSSETCMRSHSHSTHAVLFLGENNMECHFWGENNTVLFLGENNMECYFLGENNTVLFLGENNMECYFLGENNSPLFG